MKRSSTDRVQARISPTDFVGRSIDLERIIGHARGENSSNALTVLGTPSAGTSEILRQAYDRLFYEQEEIIPFYFELRRSDDNCSSAAIRFLHEFLQQTVAFRRKDARIINSSAGMTELAQLATPSDGPWIDRLIEAYLSDDRVFGNRTFISNCFGAPLRASASRAPSLVMVDGIQIANQLIDGNVLLEVIIELATRANIPFVLAGHRRFLFGKTEFPAMNVDALPFKEASRLIARLAKARGIAASEQSCDLIAVQLGGNAGHISSLVAGAANQGTELASFEDVQRIYTDEIFGGGISRHLDTALDDIVSDASAQRRIIQLLAETLDSGEPVPEAYWHKHLGLDTLYSQSVVESLNTLELVNAQSGFIDIDDTNIVVTDYIRSRVKLELKVELRASAVGDTLASNVKRAPRLMARHYRRSAALGLRELMALFDGQEISETLIDYGKFRSDLKGSDDAAILNAATDDPQKIELPQIVYTAHSEWFYPQLRSLCEAECSAVAYVHQPDMGAGLPVWIAVEFESKLEATREITEFWCDRLEMVAASNEFDDCRLWLIAPEGFGDEALQVLRDRNAYGSSRKQVELLSKVLNKAPGETISTAADEYEFVVPMGDESEMIAANTIEEIAKRHNFTPKSINQMKTALVEACINAVEHSMSPDRKIYQKFAVDPEKITITVSNRGLRLADKNFQEAKPEEGRRGWGLKLMRGLMDDVKFEQADDGTRIVMTKFLHEVQRSA